MHRSPYSAFTFPRSLQNFARSHSSAETANHLRSRPRILFEIFVKICTVLSTCLAFEIGKDWTGAPARAAHDNTKSNDLNGYICALRIGARHVYECGPGGKSAAEIV